MDTSANTPEMIEFRITEDEMAAFRRLGGDGGSAANAGDGTVVYGGLILAQVSRLLGARFPGQRVVWRSFALTFLSPLHVGECAVLHVSLALVNEDRGLIDFKLGIAVGPRSVAEGEAAALLMDTPAARTQQRISRAA